MSEREETPAGKVYEGPSGAGRSSVWLTNEDLPHDKDSRFVIDAVVLRENVKFQGGRVEASKLSLRFKRWKRELGLNATNRKIMVKLYGPRCKEWFGKEVILYVQQDVQYPNGTTGPAVRIRPRRPEPRDTAVVVQEPNLTPPDAGQTPAPPDSTPAV